MRYIFLLFACLMFFVCFIIFLLLLFFDARHCNTLVGAGFCVPLKTLFLVTVKLLESILIILGLAFQICWVRPEEILG